MEDNEKIGRAILGIRNRHRIRHPEEGCPGRDLSGEYLNRKAEREFRRTVKRQ